MIYFITDGDYIHIGHGKAKNIQTILKKIRAFNPRKIALLAMVEGNKATRSKLQKRFGRQRINSNWFEISINQVFEAVEKFNLEIIEEEVTI
jgi:hypothetical protein